MELGYFLIVEVDPHVSMSWHKPSVENTPFHPLSPSSIHLQRSPSLSNSYEQGRALELERERSEEGNGGGKEGEEEKHQHPPVDLINIFNPIMVSSRDWFLIYGFFEGSNLWILVEAWRSLARGGSIMS